MFVWDGRLLPPPLRGPEAQRLSWVQLEKHEAVQSQLCFGVFKDHTYSQCAAMKKVACLFKGADSTPDRSDALSPNVEE